MGTLDTNRAPTTATNDSLAMRPGGAPPPRPDALMKMKIDLDHMETAARRVDLPLVAHLIGVAAMLLAEGLTEEASG